MESTAKIEGTTNLEWTRVTFNWDDFIPGTTLTDIPCNYEQKILNDGKLGLTLKLTNLTESWTENEFNLLRRQVLGLSIIKGVRRKGFEEDLGFEILLDAPEFPGGEGLLADQLMNAGWGYCELLDLNHRTRVLYPIIKYNHSISAVGLSLNGFVLIAKENRYG